MQFRAAVTGKLKPAKYPSFDLDDTREGEIIDLVHETGRDVPLSKVRFEDGSISFIPAILGTKVGSKINFGLDAEIKDCLLYTSPSPRDRQKSRMPSSA